jgi:hypothetical protein
MVQLVISFHPLEVREDIAMIASRILVTMVWTNRRTGATLGPAFHEYGFTGLQAISVWMVTLPANVLLPVGSFSSQLIPGRWRPA